MKGAPPRVSHIALAPGDHAYGPIGGTRELRQLIAAHYNRLYRQGRASKYTAEHVSVACGGRLMLSRVFAALSDLNLGYQVPDYTAYEDMIGYHEQRFTPVVVPAAEADGFRIPAARLEAEVRDRGLGAFVLSNPTNPTGAVVRGPELAAYAGIARRHRCLLVLDEFYSHFIYDPDPASGEARPGTGPVSAAATVEDVDSDPVLLVDGLTKSFRYPGWRLGWAVGPRDLVEVLGRAASAIDGGPSQAVQRAALEVLAPDRADQETRALREVFARKRNLMVSALGEMGIRVHPAPEGTFYAWGSVAALPAPLDDGMGFFRAGLARKVLTVPGVFFDINPGKRRRATSPFRQWVRFSYGPPEDNVRQGLERLADMVRSARRGAPG
jgi:hypothetical protein